MALLDHFHPPLSRTHPWRGFHGAWAAAMARLLNHGILPDGFYAVPFLDRDGPIEIDVATLKNGSSDPLGIIDATQVWKPDSPGLTVAVEWPNSDDVGIEIYSDSGDPRLAAAVELVSPRNKDRPASREAFTSKCAEYLRRGCGLVVVDIVTTRRADLHQELLQLLQKDLVPTIAGALTAIAYRSVGSESDGQLFAWPHSLQLGFPLPTVPLYLGGEFAVPLDLEASYLATCHDLRIDPTT
jgi:hypothetical protein